MATNQDATSPEPTRSDRIAIPGSERRHLPGATAVTPVPADQRIEVTVTIRSGRERSGPDLRALAADQPPQQRRYLSREEFAGNHGASAADIAKIEEFARKHELVVVASRPARRSVILSGTAEALARAFDTTLEEYEYPEATYRAHTGPLGLPPDVAAIVEGVFGLDDRPQARPKFQLRDGSPLRIRPGERSAPGAFTPPELAKLYNFPAGVDGSGQCIGVIELGGGSRPADIKAYFDKLGIPAPTVKSISVDHATNSPSTASSADAEVMLDIEVAGAVAPGALIAVYYAPNTDRGFLDAVTTAVHDSVNKPSVISISWGAAEANWSEQSMTAFEQAFADAAAMGVTICCASGDNGSSDGEADGKPHVDFPSSAPHALGCGGTKLVAPATGAPTETVWNAGAASATGGGYSGFFPVPDYQAGLGNGFTGRGVPDVAGDADPASGYVVRVDGQEMVIGGTSAVAPLWAGLVALLNQQLGHPVGFLNPLLYGSLKDKAVTRDITEGSNGAQQAAPGWDACTGWGSPDGQALLRALQA
jgi:kumamolisin